MVLFAPWESLCTLILETDTFPLIWHQSISAKIISLSFKSLKLGIYYSSWGSGKYRSSSLKVLFQDSFLRLLLNEWNLFWVTLTESCSATPAGGHAAVPRLFTKPSYSRSPVRSLALEKLHTQAALSWNMLLISVEYLTFWISFPNAATRSWERYKVSL